MKYEIIYGNGPYELDYFNKEDKEMPALTRKNADFIEAIVRLDSNYKKDFDETQGPIYKLNKIDEKYHGSISYWFNEMKKSNTDFQKCVLGAVTAIDSTNSTHLNVSKNGRLEMAKKICDCCSNYTDLKEELEVPFNPSNKEHILSKMSSNIPDKNKKARFNLSFASKFCSYASYFLGLDVDYSKYDTIVSEALPEYVLFYLGEKRKKNYYVIDVYQRRSMNVEQIYQQKLQKYKHYSEDIKRIIDALKNEEKPIEISKDEFDHIVWYGNKGR